MVEVREEISKGRDNKIWREPLEKVLVGGGGTYREIKTDVRRVANKEIYDRVYDPIIDNLGV